MKFDKETWAQRLRDPVWQFISAVATIIAIIISTLVVYDVYLKAQTRQGLSVTLYQKFALVYWGKEYESDIRIYYRGNEAHDVSSFYFDLENTGDSAIRPEDYVKPLRFSVEPPKEIVDVRIDEVYPVGVDITVTQVLTNAFELSKSLLNPGDIIWFQVTLVNDPNIWSEPQLKYTGRIAGIQEITFKSYEEMSLPNFTRGYFGISFMELLGVAVLTVLLLSVTLIAFGKRVPGFWTSRFIEAKIVLLTFMTGATVFWGESLITNLMKNPGPSWWNIWLPPIIAGGLLIAVYILYLVLKLRLVSLSRDK